MSAATKIIVTSRSVTSAVLRATTHAPSRVLKYKNSDGSWCEHTYDDAGRMLTYKSSDGSWHESTYGATGRVLAYKSSYVFGGALMHALADDGEYVLFVSDAGQVTAGCQEFDTIRDALAHWDRSDEQAVMFTAALNALNDRFTVRSA